MLQFQTRLSNDVSPSSSRLNTGVNVNVPVNSNANRNGLAKPDDQRQDSAAFRALLRNELLGSEIDDIRVCTHKVSDFHSASFFVDRVRGTKLQRTGAKDQKSLSVRAQPKEPRKS